MARPVSREASGGAEVQWEGKEASKGGGGEGEGVPEDDCGCHCGHCEAPH